MGIFKDIMDTIKDIDIHGDVEKYITNKRYSSIAQQAQEGTLQFPVLVSRTMDIKTAQMISKSLERKYASFVMISTTMNPSTNSSDMSDYIRQFHQNTNTKYGKHGFVNDLMSLAKENFSCFESEKYGMMYTMCEGSTGKVMQDNKNKLSDPTEHFNKTILNNKFRPQEAHYVFKDKKLQEAYVAITEANSKSKGNPKTQNIVFNPNIVLPESPKQSTPRSGSNNSIVSDRIMRDNDIKKANELVPTTLHLKVNLMNKKGEYNTSTDFLIGIKATLHGVDSDDMINNVVGACRNKNKLFNFIKWTSGETEFVKDFLLNINNIKADVAQRSMGSSPWWLALKRRSRLANIKNKLFLPSGLLPNTTLVITLEEANFIKQQYGFDLMNPIFVDKIMSEYFLLGFVIVDNSSEMAHFMFDGQQEFEIVTFDGLERDNAGSKNGIDAKDVVKMMNRI